VDRGYSFADWGWRKIAAGRDAAVTAPRAPVLLPAARATSEKHLSDPNRLVETTVIAALS